jgi:ferrous iron transport protein A
MEHTLKDLSVGQSAEITGYASGDSGYRAKLLSMGLTRGTVVTLRKVAPMGDPVEIEVRGFSLSLRRHEAAVLKLRKTP